MIPGDGAVPPLPARRRRQRLVRCGGRTPARTGRRCVRWPTGPGRAHPGPAAPGFKSPQLQDHITAGHRPALLSVALLVAVGLPDWCHSVLTAGSRSRPALRPGNDHGDHRGTGLTLHSRRYEARPPEEKIVPVSHGRWTGRRLVALPPGRLADLLGAIPASLTLIVEPVLASATTRTPTPPKRGLDSVQHDAPPLCCDCRTPRAAWQSPS
jgi:hypothetical protein